MAHFSGYERNDPWPHSQSLVKSRCQSEFESSLVHYIGHRDWALCHSYSRVENHQSRLSENSHEYQEYREAMDIVALANEQCRCDGAINSAAHSKKNGGTSHINDIVAGGVGEELEV
jgi:hypothetical protein